MDCLKPPRSGLLPDAAIRRNTHDSSTRAVPKTLAGSRELMPAMSADVDLREGVYGPL